MKLIRCLSLCLCFVMLTSVSAWAQSEGAKMQKVLEDVKTKISVPEDYTEFSYQKQLDSGGNSSWNFRWSGDKKGSLEVTAQDDGLITSYYSWVYTEHYDDTLARYSHDQAREIARSFLSQVNPELAPYLKETHLAFQNRDSRTAMFRFCEYAEEIPVFGQEVLVTVDKYHGTVRNYQGVRKTPSLPEVTMKLTEEDAKQAYLENIGLRKEYHIYYDYRTKTDRVFPAYSLTDNLDSAIDVVTGEVITHEADDYDLSGGLRNESMDMTAKGESFGAQFSPEELKAMEDLQGVISQEETLELISKKIPGMKNFSLKNASLYRDSRNETAIYRQLTLENEKGQYAHAVVNAATGLLLSFSLPENETKKTITSEDAKAVAEAFLKQEAADVFSHTAYTQTKQHYIPLEKTEETDQPYHWVTYQRRANGIGVAGETLLVRVDAASGTVGAYERNWTEGIEFPDISQCMTEAEILEVLDKTMEFIPTWIRQKDGYRCGYLFFYGDTRMLDPFHGEPLSYDGSVAKQTQLPTYTDIRGHWAEDMILTLLDNGYYTDSNQFRPDDTITKREFLQLFRMIGNDTDRQVNELICQVEGTDSADCNATLSKETLSLYYVYRLGYQKLAEKDDLFKHPFPGDSQLDSSLIGDVAIVAGMGIFKGDSTGAFYPKKEVTRAEAVSTIYHFLNIP